jgi:hypothetical protein
VPFKNDYAQCLQLKVSLLGFHMLAVCTPLSLLCFFRDDSKIFHPFNNVPSACLLPVVKTGVETMAKPDKLQRYFFITKSF